MAEPKETDNLKYIGNRFPPLLTLAWGVLIAFALYYLFTYMWPDLKQWMDHGRP